MILGGIDFIDCTNEQSFKMKYINTLLKPSLDTMKRVFCIETEETVGGFPDVMEVLTIDRRNITNFYEFKYTKTGTIQFQATQPAFFKRNKQLDIQVVAYNHKTNNVHIFSANDIFEDTPYKIDEKGRVNLLIAEEKLR